MFAFAIWDTRRRRLFIARDRLGKKPLYYFWNGRILIFGSEIKAVLAHPDLSPRFDETLLPEYLAFGYTSGDRTLFRGIRKLMPGHHLTLDLAAAAPAPAIRQYWDIPEPRPGRRPRRRLLDPRVPRTPGRNRAHAPDERRAARHVPQRRRRFQRHRRAS